MPSTTATLTALRAELRAADPLRPAVERMPRAEVEFLLQHIAEGGSLWTADDDLEPALPLTRASIGKAHKARGTSAPLTDEWVAGFLASTGERVAA